MSFLLFFSLPYLHHPSFIIFPSYSFTHSSYSAIFILILFHLHHIYLNFLTLLFPLLFSFSPFVIPFIIIVISTSSFFSYSRFLNFLIFLLIFIPFPCFPYLSFFYSFPFLIPLFLSSIPLLCSPHLTPISFFLSTSPFSTSHDLLIPWYRLSSVSR